MDVGVRYVESRNHIPRARGVEGLDNRLANLLSDFVQAPPRVGIQIRPTVYFFHRNHQHMPVREGLDGQKCHHILAAVHESPGQFTFDDLAKYAHALQD
ncbi:hypothetical protein CGERO_01870 [Corynebacterium gerontici]|uniref:Uncharacterized protein n=1 Tax=Corynebacterium gerontici TaxID=2079234 RepID=A0A3G6IYG8_9CORY|nr:hypothetical protein CGERO_01870 [Corynebacterium gerontici]